jgi:hypothetical protein
MSLTVKILGSARLPGGGFDTAGVASNDKVFVWGELSGDYVANGVPITTADVGLSGTFDLLHLQPVTLLGAAGVGLIEPTTTIRALYSEPDGKIIMQTVVAAGDATESTATAYVVNFFACGDSAHIANLT